MVLWFWRLVGFQWPLDRATKLVWSIVSESWRKNMRMLCRTFNVQITDVCTSKKWRFSMCAYNFGLSPKCFVCDINPWEYFKKAEERALCMGMNVWQIPCILATEDKYNVYLIRKRLVYIRSDRIVSTAYLRSIYADWVTSPLFITDVPSVTAAW